MYIELLSLDPLVRPALNGACSEDSGTIHMASNTS